MSKPLTIQQFFGLFPDDEACLDHLMKVRHGGHEIDCPKCGKHGRFSRIKKMPAYACQWCGHHIHPMAGTPFERTRTPLQSWFYAMYLFTTTRHGVPAKELQRQLGVTYKTAWRMAHEIRKYMGKVDGDDGLGGHVEVDETYVGGQRKGSKPGRAIGHKTVVLGMVARGGDLMTKVIPDAKRKTIQPHMYENIKRHSVLSTDEWVAYDGLAKGYFNHYRVNHGRKEWARGNCHTNTIEGFWAHFKNSVLGTHRSVSKKHMAKYLGEFEFRFNRRHASGTAMIDDLLMAF